MEQPVLGTGKIPVQIQSVQDTRNARSDTARNVSSSRIRYSRINQAKSITGAFRDTEVVRVFFVIFVFVY